MAKKLLILTQKIDRHDPVLGFFHEWVKEFASGFDRVTVVALEVGEYDLPKNVSVYSLGKEEGKGRSTYLWRFFTYITKFRKEYDGVFVHMNQEYVLLGGMLWNLWNKKIVLWYNHTAGSILTKAAMFFADVVCHTSPYAYTAGSKKSKRMPAGIDTALFDKKFTPRTKSILYLGRIAPVKKVRDIVHSALLLDAEGSDFTLDVYGDALKEDAGYKQEIETVGETLVTKGKLRFFGAIPKAETPEVFGAHEIFVNLTPRGNYDKTVLEAAVAGAIPVVSSPAFSDLIPEELYAREDDKESLKETILKVFAMSESEKDNIRRTLKQEVIRRHDIKVLREAVVLIYS